MGTIGHQETEKNNIRMRNPCFHSFPEKYSQIQASLTLVNIQLNYDRLHQTENRFMHANSSFKSFGLRMTLWAMILVVLG